MFPYDVDVIIFIHLVKIERKSTYRNLDSQLDNKWSCGKKKV